MSERSFVADKVFLHLSDIHFQKGESGDVHDPDADLRNELERDLRTICTTLVQKVDGIIVSGDIAFGGQQEEFDFAKGWLERIRELINCPPDGIMVTPGNHDVDRALIVPGGDIEQMHDTIRNSANLLACDAALASVLRDNVRGAHLFSPVSAYNKFAREFGCAVSAMQPYWERDFQLGHSGVLRIRGMTSTLISGPHDHITTHKLMYGTAQRALPRQDGVLRAIVGHHPPSWTIEGDEADRAFSDRAVIQLFGHKHDMWYTRAGRGVRLIAGAIHPARNENNWDPRYSLIAIRLAADGRLHIRVYPREWSREETLFKADFTSQARDYREHVVEPG